jgi:hypothetical protein
MSASKHDPISSDDKAPAGAFFMHQALLLFVFMNEVIPCSGALAACL